MTYNFYIPVSKLQDIQKLVNKYSRHIAIEAEYSAPEDRIFLHTVLGNTEFGAKAVGMKKMMHRVVDVTIKVDFENEWQIVAEFNSGELVFVADPTKPLVFSNPAHGADYNKCDCCSHKVRKCMFVLENTITGEEVQIGAECAKSYGVFGVKYMERLAAELREVFDFTMSTGSGTYAYRGTDPYERRVVETVKVFELAARYYEATNGVWQSGYDNGFHYVPSKSRGELMKMVEEEYESTQLEHTDLYDKVKAYAETIVVGKYDEFNEGVKKAMMDVYMPVDNVHFSFFAIKSYYKHLEELAQKFHVGDYVHVVGKVVNTKVLEGMYGMYEINEVETVNGNHFIRKGSVKEDADKNVNFYAFVENAYKGTYYLGKVTKNPKKGNTIVEA